MCTLCMMNYIVFYRFPTSDSGALWSRRWPPATIVWRVNIWSFDIVRLLVNNGLHAWAGWRRYGRTSGFIWRFERILVGHHDSVFGKLRFCSSFYFLTRFFGAMSVSVELHHSENNKTGNCSVRMWVENEKIQLRLSQEWIQVNVILPPGGKLQCAAWLHNLTLVQHNHIYYCMSCWLSRAPGKLLSFHMHQ